MDGICWNLQTFKGDNIDCNCYLVGGRIRAGLSNVNKQNGSRMVKYSKSALKCESNHMAYKYCLEAVFEDDKVELEKEWTVCRYAIHKAIKEILGEDRAREVTKSFWFDETYMEALWVTNNI